MSAASTILARGFVGLVWRLDRAWVIWRLDRALSHRTPAPAVEPEPTPDYEANIAAHWRD